MVAFKSIADIPVHVKQKEPAQPFISVNKYTGGYLGGGLYVRLGRPTHLKVEYDEETQVLRIAVGTEQDVEIRGQGFRLPELVRHTLSAGEKSFFKTTVRYRVEQEDDWWYITEVLQ